MSKGSWLTVNSPAFASSINLFAYCILLKQFIRSLPYFRWVLILLSRKQKYIPGIFSSCINLGIFCDSKFSCWSVSLCNLSPLSISKAKGNFGPDFSQLWHDLVLHVCFSKTDNQSPLTGMFSPSVSIPQEVKPLKSYILAAFP